MINLASSAIEKDEQGEHFIQCEQEGHKLFSEVHSPSLTPSLPEKAVFVHGSHILFALLETALTKSALVLAENVATSF